MPACKNQEPTKQDVAQSGGINEKPRKHWRVAGYPLLLTASFASILGGDGVRLIAVRKNPVESTKYHT